MNFIEKLKKNINKKLEKEIQKYVQENIDELSKILNRPIEGEIVKISNIKIHECFKEPNAWRLKLRREYYEKHKYFRSTVVLDNNNYLVDGYTTYLIAKEKGFDYITIVRMR